jgi:hypothetical protein
MSKTTWILSFIAFAVFLAAVPGAPASAEEVKQRQKLDNKRVDEAVKKGVEFLKTQQKPDGSWSGTLFWENLYPYGTTALCLFAIVKGGEPKNSPAVKKALNYLTTPPNKWKYIYEAATLVLALAALAEEDEEEKTEEPPKDGEPAKDLRTAPLPEDPGVDGKKNLKKLNPNLSGLMKEAVDYIITNKRKEDVWRYPGLSLGGPTDASNTQYACMALFAARRLGFQIPNAMFVQIAEYFLKQQQPDGPEVPGFRVPGADLCMADLLDIEKEWRKNFNKMLAEDKKAAKKEGKEFEGADLNTVPRDNPYDNPNIGAEIGKFKARGWSYVPQDAPKTQQNMTVPQFMYDFTGSMTCSGVICCMLSKLYLEKTSWYKQNGKKLERAIRDGLAWLVTNWKTDMNPGAGAEDSWRYYYFYAIERAAVLTILLDVGSHDWHYEIGNIILGEQQADGSWKGVKAVAPQGIRPFEHGPLWNTCFAILFLKKATTPIVKEEVIYTGEGLLKNAPKPEKEEPKKPAPEPEPPKVEPKPEPQPEDNPGKNDGGSGGGDSGENSGE